MNIIFVALFNLFKFFIPIDMLNGYLLRSFNISFSLYLKFVVLVILVFILIRTAFKVHTIALLLCTSLVFFLSGVLHADLSYLDNDYGIFKFSSIYIFGLFFAHMIKLGYVDKVVMVIKCTYFFILVNTLFGMAGLGYPMYGSGLSAIGTRGLIFAGNELGFLASIAGGFLTFVFLLKKRYLLFVLVGLSMIVNALLLASKVAMLGAIILPIVSLFVYTLYELRKRKVSPRLFILIVAIIMLGLPGFAYYIQHYFLHSEIASRNAYFIDNLGLVTGLLSGRDARIFWGLEVYLTQFGPVEMLFGGGEKAIYAESDFFDILFLYGFFGLCFSLSVFLVPFGIAVLRLNVNPYAGYLIFIFLFSFGVSMAAGHAIVSGLASLVFGAATSFLSINATRSHEKGLMSTVCHRKICNR